MNPTVDSKHDLQTFDQIKAFCEQFLEELGKVRGFSFTHMTPLESLNSDLRNNWYWGRSDWSQSVHDLLQKYRVNDDFHFEVYTRSGQNFVSLIVAEEELLRRPHLLDQVASTTFAHNTFYLVSPLPIMISLVRYSDSNKFGPNYMAIGDHKIPVSIDEHIWARIDHKFRYRAYPDTQRGLSSLQSLVSDRYGFSMFPCRYWLHQQTTAIQPFNENNPTKQPEGISSVLSVIDPIAEQLSPLEKSVYQYVRGTTFGAYDGTPLSKVFNVAMRGVSTVEELRAVLEPIMADFPSGREWRNNYYYGHDDGVKRAPIFHHKLAAFKEVREASHRVSTPVLLQVREHMAERLEGTSSHRTFMPKGSMAKVYTIENNLPPIPDWVCSQIEEITTKTLKDRFSTFSPMGKVYIDPRLDKIIAPYSQRSASASVKALTRGSRMAVNPEASVIRFYVWWQENAHQRADVDLSLTFLDESFKVTHQLYYGNLRGNAMRHSGDITSAPNGACEFIDVDLTHDTLSSSRYVTATLITFTGQPFSMLKECFMGWMERPTMDRGEIFDPRTVTHQIDVTAQATSVVPLIFDIKEREVVWCDIAGTQQAFASNVETLKNKVVWLSKAMVFSHKTSMGDILKLHAESRGKIVDSPEKADVVFSLDEGTHQKLEEFASEYMK